MGAPPSCESSALGLTLWYIRTMAFLSERVRRPREAGVALMTVIILMAVLFMASNSLVTLATSDIFGTRRAHHRTVALFAGEAATARCEAILAQQLDWTEGFNQEKMENVGATYTVVFNTSGSNVQPNESVNNLNGTTEVDGPRGPGTVPPNTVDLVVIVRAGLVERRLEVLLNRGIADPSPFAVISSRNILMRGDVQVDGLESLDSGATVEAGLHSNRLDSVDDIIQWSPKSAGDRAEILGDVSTTSPATTAIDFGANPSAYDLGGTTISASNKPLPPVDIEGEVSARSGASTPSLNAPIPDGEYYLSGDTVINDDLVLEGGNLYINGSLTVNGSISGEGGIYVNGETHFRGDVRISTANEKGAALFSKGSVSLTGFDGSEYLSNLVASDSVAQENWDHLTTTIDELKVYIDGGGDDVRTIKEYCTVISEEVRVSPWQGRNENTSGELLSFVKSKAPAGDTRDFLVDRLEQVGRDFCCQNHNSWNSRSESEWLADFLAGGDSTGIFMAVYDGDFDEHRPSANNILAQTDYNKLGTSFFQGVIYTNGYLYASNEISVVGAVFAEDDGSQTGATIGSVTVEPGDVFLDNKSRFTFVEDYVEAMGSTGGFASVTRKSWMER
jgi:hypothetical protein